MGKICVPQFLSEMKDEIVHLKLTSGHEKTTILKNQLKLRSCLAIDTIQSDMFHSIITG